MILHKILWDFFGRVSNQAITFIISVLLARILDPEDFGLVGMILVVCAIAQAYLDVGFSAALIQKKDVHIEEFNSVFVINVILGLILSTALFLSSDLIAAFYINNKLIPLNQALSSIIFIGSFSVIFRARCIRNMQFKKLANINLLSNIISGCVGIGMALSGFGVWSIVIQQISQRILETIFLVITSKWKPKFQFSFIHIQSLWIFSSKKIITELMRAILLRLDQIIIGRLFSAATLGFYTRSKALNDLVVNNSSGSITTVLFPYFSSKQDDIQEVQRVFLKSFRIISIIAAFLAGILFLNSYEVFTLIYTDKWSTSAFYFLFLICSDGVTRPLLGVSNNALLAMGLANVELKLLIIKRAIWLLPLCLLWNFGIETFLYSVVGYSYIITILSSYYVKRYLAISITTQLRPLLLNTTLAALIVLGLRLIDFQFSDLVNLILKSGIFTFLFIALLRIAQQKILKEILNTFKMLLKTNN